MKILCFDTETTGIIQRNAPWIDFGSKNEINLSEFPRIVQLAWISYDTVTGIRSENDYIIKPDNFTIPQNSIDIHGITNEIALAKGQDLRGILIRFLLDYDQSDIIVAHNYGFDSKVVASEVIRSRYVVKTKKPHICTMLETTNYCKLQSDLKGYKWPKLNELHEILFKKKFENAHNALNDVKATLDCFLESLRLGWIVLPKSAIANSEILSIVDKILSSINLNILDYPGLIRVREDLSDLISKQDGITVQDKLYTLLSSLK